MLAAADPRGVDRNLHAIVAHSRRVGAWVILARGVSTPKRDPSYKPSFDEVDPTLSAREKAPLYPFSLDSAFGIHSDRRLPPE